MRVQVGDRFGNLLAELQPQLGPCSWILNGVGRTEITLAKSDEKATGEILHIANRVYIDEFDNGLPPWGGVMYLPRKWTTGTVSVACYGIERLLEKRRTRKNDAFYEWTAGAIFAELLERNELKDPMGIVTGNVWMGGRSHWPRYHYKDLWDVLTDSLRKIEQCDFRFMPFVESGRIQFQADFFQVAGSDKTASVALVEGGPEGGNVDAMLTMEEQGDMINVAIAVGTGSTWGNERTAIVARDSDSVAANGLMEDCTVYSSVSVPATLEMHARNTLSENSRPRRIFSLPVTDREPGTFASYDIGDTVRATLPTFGFGGYDGSLRVIAREFNPQTGGCKIVVEEQHTADAWVYQDQMGEDTP